MKDPQLNIDSRWLDRLVDGELAPKDQRRLLAALDEEPGGWRQCALAFIESQAWGQAIDNTMHPELSPSTLALDKTSMLPTEQQAVLQSEQYKTPDLPNNTAYSPKKPVVQQADVKQPNPYRYLALAAGLLLAFSAGFLVQRSITPRIAKTPNRSTKNTIVNVDKEKKVPWNLPCIAPQNGETPPHKLWANTAIANDPNRIRLIMEDSSGGKQHVFESSLIESKMLDREIGALLQPAIPNSVRRRLELLGYRVETKLRYAPVQIPSNGVQAIIPVDDTKIIPIARKIL